MKSSSVFLVCLFAIGIFLRLYSFENLPFGLNHDGALEGLEAIDLSQHPLPFRPYSEIGWQGESLFRYFLALLIYFFGPYAWVIKLGSTLFSILTLFSFYLFSKEIFGKKIAIYSLFFLSISGWHIIMGKTVWRAITLPFFESLFFYFFIRFIKHHNRINSILSGLLLALCLYTYNSARIIPLFSFFILLLYAFQEKSKLTITKIIGKFSLFLATFLIVIAPLAFYALENSEKFNSRAQFLFVGNRIKEEKSLKPLVDNLKKTALIFNVKAGGDDFFVNEPLLDFPVSFLYLFGIIYSIYHFKKFPNSFILLGFLFNLTPGLITIPNGNRDIGILPFIYVFTGIGIDFLNRLVERFTNSNYKKASALFIIFIFVISFLVTYSIYYSNSSRKIFGFYPETTVVGNYMKQNLATSDFYLTDNFPRDILTFLTYTKGNPYVKHYSWYERGDSFFSISHSPNKNTVFIMLPIPTNELLLEKLHNKYPNGKLEELSYFYNGLKEPAAWVFIVPPDKISFLTH